MRGTLPDQLDKGSKSSFAVGKVHDAFLIPFQDLANPHGHVAWGAMPRGQQ